MDTCNVLGINSGSALLHKIASGGSGCLFPFGLAPCTTNMWPSFWTGTTISLG